jgi:hypothetical protein
MLGLTSGADHARTLQVQYFGTPADFPGKTTGNATDAAQTSDVLIFGNKVLKSSRRYSILHR